MGDAIRSSLRNAKNVELVNSERKVFEHTTGWERERILTAADEAEHTVAERTLLGRCSQSCSCDAKEAGAVPSSFMRRWRRSAAHPDKSPSKCRTPQ